MIKQLILVGLLASASLALASPTKGRRDDAPIKGEAPRVQQQLETTAETYQQQKLATEQQAPAKGRPDEAELAQRRVEAPAASKTSARAEQAEQRREEWTQQREEARGQQREEELGQQQQQQQVKEEAAPQQQQQVREEASAASFFKQHYEAKTQAREEAPAKEAQRPEELEDKRASAKTSKPALEQQQKVAVVEESKVVVREQQQLRETHFEQQRLPELPQQQVELVSQQRDSEQIVQQQQQQRQEFDEEQRQVAGVKGQLAQAPVPETEPYAFEYSVEGSTRRESGDTKGVVRGQYSVANGDGSRRIVDYIADRDGFRASVVTNEFGTESRAPASVSLRSSQPSAEEISLRFEASKTSARDESGAAVKGQLVEQAPAPAQPAQPAPVPATPPKPDNWNVAPAKGYAERIATVQTAVESASQQLEEPARLSAKGIEQQPLQQQQAAPTKQISRLEETSLPAARKAYEEPRKAELPPLPLPQLQRSAEVVKSAELRQPKSIDLYASRVLPLTANARQPHQQHHPAQPHVRPVQSPSRNHQHRQLSQAGHHSPPLRAGAQRESSPATVGRHQQPAGGSVSRLVHQAPAHDQRAQAVRVSSYSSEEDAPLGFEAS